MCMWRLRVEGFPLISGGVSVEMSLTADLGSAG